MKVFWQMLKPYHIHALHGFLGQPSDWPHLELVNKEQFHTYQLLKDFPIRPFSEWAERFNQKAAGDFNIFMGYSLGGRLGLHAISRNPEQWKAAIFVSTHPGLKSMDERKNRVATDDQWAERFLNDPWNQLMNDWNAQDIFKGDALVPQREESENDRQSLSKAFKIWSLGMQNDLRAKIASLEMPILWMVGERDHKYLKLAQELKFKHPLSKLCVVPETGHRLQFEQPEKFILNVSTFIQHLETQ
jgi:2-succinyl-6-hydroxy-2,4-cyclohexadiene-1-carboxylate synthase